MYSLYPIRKHAGDYSKLENYENITGYFGEGFCVPIALKIVENSSYSEEDFNRSVDEYLTRFNVLYN